MGAFGSTGTLWQTGIAVGVALAALGGVGLARADTFVVDTTSFDAGDLDLSDDVCGSINGACTLRAAVEQANVLKGADSIILPPSTEPYLLDMTHPTSDGWLPLTIRDDVGIYGFGPEVSIIDGGGTNPLLWVETAEAFVLDVSDEGSIARARFSGRLESTVHADTGGLNLSSHMRLLDGDILVTSRDGGVLRFEEITGLPKGYAVPPFLNGEPLEVGDVDIGPDGLLYVTRVNGGEVMRFDADTGAFVDTFISGGPFLSRTLRWLSVSGVPALFVTRDGNGAIRRYDESGNLVQTIESGYMEVTDFVVYENVIYAATGEGDTVHRFDLPTGQDLGPLVTAAQGSGLGNALFIALGPHDAWGQVQEVFVTSNDNRQVLRFDILTGAFGGVFTQGGPTNPNLDRPGPVVFRQRLLGDLGPTVQVEGLALANGLTYRANFPSAGIAIHFGATVTMSRCEVRDNLSRVWGGGVQNYGDLTIRECSITGNQFDQSAGPGGQTATGGGIFNGGRLTIEDSLVAYNIGGRGGGLAQGLAADRPRRHRPFSTILNTTIAENTSQREAGGVRLSEGLMQVSFSTIARNLAAGGDENIGIAGGIFVGPTLPGAAPPDELFLMMANSIIAENYVQGVGSGDCWAPIDGSASSWRDNIIGVKGDFCTLQDAATGGDDGMLFGTEADPWDPGLSDLADHGGPTLSYTLLADSAALDGDVEDPPFGNTFFFCPDHDQRQLSRPVDGDGDGAAFCDIGASEMSGGTPADLDGDGINDTIDSAPHEFSSFFSDEALGGSTNGQVLGYGAQRLTIEPANPASDGVVISAAPSGGLEPAVLLLCDGQLPLELAAGENATIQCVTADAGADQLLECTDGQASAVLLGSGTSPVDADLSYQWSAAGIVFDHENAAETSAIFPVGQTTATLTVSLGSLSATDSAQVTVVDTTPPILNVPGDVIVQSCRAVDLGEAAAADTCGGSVSVFNDAPAIFSAGLHEVTWTAIDAFGNQTQKTQHVWVGLGNDASCCPAGTNVIVGTSNGDTLWGTSGSDCIVGRGGQDVIHGRGGSDIIGGGDGNDTMYGGSGDDFIDGGTGQDSLLGEDGADALFGNDGTDQLRGGSQADWLHGGEGQDQLFGEGADDVIFGGSGDDALWGGDGADVLIGGGLHDQCDGQAGNNTFLLCDNRENTSSPLQATFTITDDWGDGYCVQLAVTNPTAMNATDIAITFNLPQGTIFNHWNGLLNGDRGVLTMIPSMSWNQSLYPGEVDTTLGFCAFRDQAWSSAPTVLATSARF